MGISAPQPMTTIMTGSRAPLNIYLSVYRTQTKNLPQGKKPVERLNYA